MTDITFNQTLGLPTYRVIRQGGLFFIEKVTLRRTTKGVVYEYPEIISSGMTTAEEAEKWLIYNSGEKLFVKNVNQYSNLS